MQANQDNPLADADTEDTDANANANFEEEHEEMAVCPFLFEDLDAMMSNVDGSPTSLFRFCVASCPAIGLGCCTQIQASQRTPKKFK